MVQKDRKMRAARLREGETEMSPIFAKVVDPRQLRPYSLENWFPSSYLPENWLISGLLH